MSPEARERSFDDLARGLADGSVTRGKALRLIGAALVGGALASIPGTAWAARCPSSRIKCRGQCCPAGVSTCVGTGGNKTCGPCPNGTEACGGTCTDLSTSTTNCGTCGNACGTGEICEGGECQQCPTGTTICDVGGTGPECVSNVCPEGFIYNPQSCLCDPLCTPSCPQGTCFCAVRGDGSGNVCAATGGVGGAISVDDCNECPPADFPDNTVCINIGIGGGIVLQCVQPCPQ